MHFSELGLKPEILRAVEERGYKEPTPIQEMAIPLVMMGRDVLGCAQTGTGKTAGFCLPMMEILSSGRAKARMPRSIILEPTRELAAQVAENFAYYGKYLNLSVALLTGGGGMDEQIKKLALGVDVLIVTLGRMLDLHERGNVMLHDIKIFVIDEADRMMDMGFMPDIEKISGLLPKIRQTLFFSATMPPEIRKLADKFLINPKEVSVAPPATTAATVEQSIIKLHYMEKRKALRALLTQNDFKSAFVFCNRKRDINVLVESLQRHGFKAAGLHGDMPQNKRNEALDQFKSGATAILVCSDVAARGLDIKGVDAVFNFDVPFDADNYVHRIGRTGRAGRDGKAFMFVAHEDADLLNNITALIKKEIPEIKVAGVEAVEHHDQPVEHRHFTPRHRDARGGGRSSERGGGGGGRRGRGGQRDEGRRQQGSGHRRPPYERSAYESDSREPLPASAGFGDDVPAFLRTERPKSVFPQEEKSA